MKKIIAVLLFTICALFLIAGDAVASFINLEGIIMTLPEPAAMLLLGSGMFVLSVIGRKKLIRK